MYYRILDILEIRPDIAVKEIAGIVSHIGSTKKGKWIIFKSYELIKMNYYIVGYDKIQIINFYNKLRKNNLNILYIVI